MTFSCYTFLKFVAKTQHYETTTLHDRGPRPMGFPLIVPQSAPVMEAPLVAYKTEPVTPIKTGSATPAGYGT
jgi:hypothetical protein